MKCLFCSKNFKILDSRHFNKCHFYILCYVLLLKKKFNFSTNVSFNVDVDSLEMFKLSMRVSKTFYKLLLDFLHAAQIEDLLLLEDIQFPKWYISLNKISTARQLLYKKRFVNFFICFLRRKYRLKDYQIVCEVSYEVFYNFCCCFNFTLCNRSCYKKFIHVISIDNHNDRIKILVDFFSDNNLIANESSIVSINFKDKVYSSTFSWLKQFFFFDFCISNNFMVQLLYPFWTRQSFVFSRFFSIHCAFISAFTSLFNCVAMQVSSTSTPRYQLAFYSFTQNERV